MSLSILAEPIVTGRAAYLELGTTDTPAPSSVTIERMSSQTGTWTTIHDGDFPAYYIDAGEMQSVPLDPAYTYTYRLTDTATASSVTSSAISVNSSIKVIRDPTEPTLIRLIEGAVNSLVPPDGFKQITFLHAMPLSSFPEMPIVTVNLDLLQQQNIPIGMATRLELDPTSYINTIQERQYSVYVLANNPDERNYYQEAVTAVLYNLSSTFLNIGGSINYSVQATQGQVSKDSEGLHPGFFYAQIMVIISFNYKTTLQAVASDYNTLLEIDTTATPAGTYTNT